MDKHLTPARRKAVYRTLVAIGALLVVYGLVGPEEIEAWLAVANAALLAIGGGLASHNVTDDAPEDVYDIFE